MAVDHPIHTPLETVTTRPLTGHQTDQVARPGNPGGFTERWIVGRLVAPLMISLAGGLHAGTRVGFGSGGSFRLNRHKLG